MLVEMSEQIVRSRRPYCSEVRIPLRIVLVALVPGAELEADVACGAQRQIGTHAPELRATAVGRCVDSGKGFHQARPGIASPVDQDVLGGRNAECRTSTGAAIAVNG